MLRIFLPSITEKSFDSLCMIPPIDFLCLFYFAAGLLVAHCLSKAPLGYEDDDGFHEISDDETSGKPAKAMRKRYSSPAKGTREYPRPLGC